MRYGKRPIKSKPLSLPIGKKAKSTLSMPIDIPGFYYDKGKNRYFPINTNNHTKAFGDYLIEESLKVSLIKKPSEKPPEGPSYFSSLHQHKRLPSFHLKSTISRSQLKRNFYSLSSYEDIRSNKMFLYKGAYIIYKDTGQFNQFGSIVSAFKPGDDNFFKKLFVNINNSPIDRVSIINNQHIALYRNWSLTLMINPSFTSWLTSPNASSISLTLTQPFSFLNQIKNASSLSVEFEWPLIKESTSHPLLFYCLIDQSFCIIKPSTLHPIHKPSSDTLFITSSDLLNKVSLVSAKVFNTKRFSNFLIEANDTALWLFEINGSIFKYDLLSYKPMMKIINAYISIITFTFDLTPSLHLLLTESHNLLAFDSRAKTITALYLSAHSNYIQLANENKLWFSYPFVFFQDENRQLLQYSIETYEVVNSFRLEPRQHHRLTLGSEMVIAEISL